MPIKYNPGVNPKLLDQKLQKALFFIDKASTFEIICTSGLRTPEHNAEVGGSPTSSHLKGLACDFSTPDSKTRYWIRYWAYMAGIRRLGQPKIGDHLHLDIDYTKVNPCDFIE
jgi:hypothetical protein